MKANYEEDKVIVSATEPTRVNRKKVWFKKGKNLSNINSFNSVNTLQNTFIIKSKVVANSYIIISLTKSRISDTTITNNIIYGISKIKLYNKSDVLLNTIVGKTFSNFTSGSINVEEKITIPADCDYIVVDCSNNNGDNNYNTSVTDIMIEQNTVKTTYEQYIEPEIYILNNNNVYEKMYSNSIIENGSNSYFKYIKFSDGTLIQYGTMIFNNLTWNSWGSLYYAECNVSQYKFPVPFIDRPVVNGSIAHGTGSGDGWISRIGGTSTTDIESLAIARPTTYADSMYVNITAIGRWK